MSQHQDPQPSSGFFIEHGLLLSEQSLVEFAEGCAEAVSAPSFVPGTHEAGAEVPCPHCPGEHRISHALSIPLAHNVEIREAEPDETEPGN